MCNQTDIAQIIGMLSAAFPNYKVSEYTPSVYYETLKDIRSDELKAAVLHCVSQPGRAFAPSIGEIRGAVGELRKYSANLPSSYQAWQEVLTQMRENGGDHGNPVWSHPLVERAVKTMGWRELRMSENQTADRARFLQCYEQLSERAEREDLLLPEVRGYLEVNGAQLPAPAEQIRRLASGMHK